MGGRWIGALALLVAVAGLAPAAARAADPTAPGSLDATFAGRGVLRTSLGVREAVPIDMAVLPGRRILLLGAGSVVGRLTVGGRPDRRFANGGHTRIALGGDGNDALTALAPAPGGRTVLAGHQRVDRLAVVRLLGNGSFDPKFGRNGRVIRDTQGQVYGADVTVAPDGGIDVAAIEYSGFPEAQRLLVASLTRTGAPRPGTGDEGIVTLPLPAPVSYASQVFLMRARDGRLRVVIELGEEGREGLFLIGLTPDGRPDESVGAGGVRLLRAAFSGALSGAAMDAGDRIVLAARAGSDRRPRLAVMRTSANGDPDPRFGAGGLAQVALVRGDEPGRLATADDGRVAVALTHRPRRGHARPGVVLLRANGAPARLFGRRGRLLVTALGSRHDATGTQVGFDAQERLVLAGEAGDGLSDIREDLGRDWAVLARLRLRRADVRFAPTARVSRHGVALLEVRCRPQAFGCTGTVTLGRASLRARARMSAAPRQPFVLRFALGRAGRLLAERGSTVRLVANVAAAGRLDDIALPVRLVARERRSRR